METMKAARIHDYGGPEAISYDEISRPVAQEGELLIKVHAIGVNPMDWKIREGLTRGRFTLPMPAILGGDVSGVVEQVGAGVSGFKPGDEVFAMLGLFGAYAQYVTVKAALVARKPRSVTHEQSASFPLASLTAWQALFDHGHLKAGQRVLVHAAAGGVGGFAVQLARWKGAQVIGTASRPNAEYVKELGAQSVIDYGTERFEDKAFNVDVVVDLVGGEVGDRSVSVLKPGGVLVQVAPGTEKTPQLAAAANVNAVKIQVKPDGKQLQEISELIDARLLKTYIAAVLPLSAAGLAQQQVKTGHTRGKIVLTAV